MRPAVHASILRYRNRNPRRHMRMRQHKFSAKYLMLMVFAGILLFIPGLVLTVIHLKTTDEDYDGMSEEKKIMYQAIGPAMCTVGSAVMFASCIYFYCYGTGPQASSPTPNNQRQSFSDHDPDDKGSIRSKHRDHSHHHHHHHHHHQHNGRVVDIQTPDSECRRSLRGDDGAVPNAKAPHRTSSLAAEEEVPLAKMEDSSDLATKGGRLKVPTVMIHIQAPSDSDDFDWADEVSVGRESMDGRVKAEL